MSESTPRPRRTTKTYKDLRVLRGEYTPRMSTAQSESVSSTASSSPPPKVPTFSSKPSSKKFVRFIVIGSVFFLVLGVCGWYLLGRQGIQSLSQSSFTLFTARVFGMSVAEINGKEISYVDYRDQLRATKMFFDTDMTGNLTKLSDREMQDYVLARLLINELTDQVAREYRVTLDSTELGGLVDTQLVQNFGSRESAEENIVARYGWTLDQFAHNIIRPAELERKLIRSYLDSIGYPVPKEELKSRAQAVLDRIKSGEDFESLAREYGMDSTAQNGGGTGWFVRGMFENPMDEIVFSLETGELASDLIETERGFYIARLDDRKMGTDPESGREREELSAHVIFFRLDTDDARPYAEYMNQRLLESVVEVAKGIVNPLANFYTERSGT